MSRPTKPRTPKLPKNLSVIDFSLEDEGVFEAVSATDVDFSGSVYKNVVIRESMLEKLTMQRTKFENIECKNVIFNKCDLSNLE